MEMEGQKEHSTGDTEQEVKNDTFKKPQLCLVGPRKSKGSKVRVVDCYSEQKPKEEKVEPFEKPELISPLRESTPESTKVDESDQPLTNLELKTQKPQKSPSTIPAQKLKETPIPYLEPKWGGIPLEEYSLDVIKSGTVLEPIKLSAKSYYVFGRQTNCDIQMAHPTASRHHAVLQFSRGTDDKPQGFYLFDLGSTHGTFLNKSRVRPEMFIRIKVGHQIKLGGSTRLYLLQGPPEDMEAESDLTVTELKAKRQLEIQARELAEINRKQKEDEDQRKREEDQRKREEDGIDWGMGDDADEETDLSENPYAITTNEELYIDDPKKTLRGWFEREGHELEYDVEEKGPGQFLCRVDVPVEGARGGCMVAEALVKGKKKEAVAQCALEACRLLDRLGLLRQATHESRKRKVKNWEDDDFYDSDEDTFLDRTGSVEKKRQTRMKQAGKNEEQVETYQSLSEKHSNVLKTLESTKVQLRKAQADLAAAKLKDEEEGDTLDSFMSTLSKVGCADKKLISKLKVDLAALHKDEAQLRKLVNIAKPASLPELVAPVSKSTASTDSNVLKNKSMLAARKKANQKQQVSFTSIDKDAGSTQEESNNQEEEDEEEYSSREQGISTGSDKQIKQVEGTKEDMEGSPLDVVKGYRLTSKDAVNLIGPSKPSFIETSTTVDETETREPIALAKNVDGDDNDGDDDDDDNDDDDDDDDDERNSKEAERRKKKNRRRLLLRNEKALERTKAHYNTSDPNYSVWVPPEDQSGDGTTKLNAKLGY